MEIRAGRRRTGYASAAGKPIPTCYARSRPLITDRALVCGWCQLPTDIPVSAQGLAVRAARRTARSWVMAKIGHARVSTRSQNDYSQVDDLTAYGCEKISTGTASGKNAARPELDRALAYLVALGQGRLPRSLDASHS
jgi:N-methylhydantoinase A/oxoprolinase/acetone carboxylase beta subunit